MLFAVELCVCVCLFLALYSEGSFSLSLWPLNENFMFSYLNRGKKSLLTDARTPFDTILEP